MRDPEAELRALEGDGLRRLLRRIESPQGTRVDLADQDSCLNFSSNDYLGLATNEGLKAAYQSHIGRLG